MHRRHEKTFFSYNTPISIFLVCIKRWVRVKDRCMHLIPYWSAKFDGLGILAWRFLCFCSYSLLHGVTRFRLEMPRNETEIYMTSSLLALPFVYNPCSFALKFDSSNSLLIPILPFFLVDRNSRQVALKQKQNSHRSFLLSSFSPFASFCSCCTARFARPVSQPYKPPAEKTIVAPTRTPGFNLLPNNQMLSNKLASFRILRTMVIVRAVTVAPRRFTPRTQTYCVAMLVTKNNMSLGGARIAKGRPAGSGSGSRGEETNLL